MISYKIISRQLSQPSRRKPHPDDFDYREKRYERLFTANRIKVGDRVRMVNSQRKGIVTEIYEDANKVLWVDNNPHFIDVLFDDIESIEVASPFQLTKKGAHK